MFPQDSSLPSCVSLLGNYQLGSNSRGQIFDEVVPESPFTIHPPLAKQEYPTFSRPSVPPPITELAAISLKNPKCPQCKGKRFDFTAYFHNPKFFRSPPHELLHLVEMSYILKNRLQSILITYIVHDLHDDHMMKDVRADINHWVLQVSGLAGEVGETMGNADGVADGLVGVQQWTTEMARQFGEHLDQLTGQKMEVPKGWKKEILSGFRRRWERVWISCSNGCAFRREIASVQEGSHQTRLDGSVHVCY